MGDTSKNDPELNVQVAGVMGWEIGPGGYYRRIGDAETKFVRWPYNWYPSSSLDHALEVVEKLRKDGWMADIRADERFGDVISPGYSVNFYQGDPYGDYTVSGSYTSPDLCQSICLAALDAVKNIKIAKTMTSMTSVEGNEYIVNGDKEVCNCVLKQTEPPKPFEPWDWTEDEISKITEPPCKGCVFFAPEAAYVWKEDVGRVRSGAVLCHLPQAAYDDGAMCGDFSCFVPRVKEAEDDGQE